MECQKEEFYFVAPHPNMWLCSRVLKLHFEHRDELFLLFLFDSVTVYTIRNYCNTILDLLEFEKDWLQV